MQFDSFLNQTADSFTAGFAIAFNADVASDASLQVNFLGSGITYDADGLPLDGTFTQVTIGVEYTLIGSDMPVTVIHTYYTTVSQDISDLFDAGGTPEDTMNATLLTIGLFGAFTGPTLPALEGDRGISIYAASSGGRTTGTRDNDVIRVGDDSSWFLAGWGNDVMVAQDGPVRFKGQAGDDQLVGAGGADVLRGGSGNDIVYGGAGDDKIYGQSGNDGLRGGDGDDWVLGGAGRDYLIAGAGRDQLVGGAGADMFVFNIATEDTTLSAHKIEDGRNVVRDFDFAEDVLRFGVGYNSTLTQVDAFAWFSEHATDAGDKVRIVDGNVRIIIKNASVDDFSIEHFAGSDTHGNYDAWLLG